MSNPRRTSALVLALGLVLLSVAPALAVDPEISAEVRVREYLYFNQDFDSDVEDANNYAAMRTRIGLDFAAGEYASAFVQFQDTRALGEPVNTVTSLEQVDLHQGYVLVRNVYNGPLSLQLGRQEMKYGAERQIGALGWSDVGRSFDGLKVLYDIEDFGWLHLFAMKLNETGGVTTINSGAGVTTSDVEQAFLGAYLHYDAGENGGLEVYVLDVYTDDGDVGPVGSEEDATGNLFTTGARATWQDGDSGVKLYGEGAFQFGSAPKREVSGVVEDGPDYNAYAAVAGIHYALPTSKPTWLAFEFNLASGDDGTDATEVNTYTQLFPTGHGVLGYMDFVGWRNIMAYQGTLGTKPNDQWKFWASYHYFQVAEEADGWYAANGSRLLAGGADFDTALGSEVDVAAQFTVDQNLSFLAKFGMWMPGSWQEQATSGDAASPADLDPAYTVYVQTTASF